MISGGILQAANVPDSFNARTCSLSSGGRDKSSSVPRARADPTYGKASDADSRHFLKSRIRDMILTIMLGDWLHTKISKLFDRIATNIKI